MSFSMVCDTVLAQLEKIRIVPVLVLNDLDTGLKMCEVLSECGLPAAEITFRTQAAASIIKAASERFPELYLGAGTILNVADLKRAFDSGAKFAVAPGFNPTVVRAAVESHFAFAPEAAGGTKMLKSIIAPYKHLGVRFMPTGGVTTANVMEYLSVKEVVAVGGTWLGKADDIAAGNWDKIREIVKQAVALKEGK